MEDAKKDIDDLMESLGNFKPTKEWEYKTVKKEVTRILCHDELTDSEKVNELNIFLGMMWNED